MVSCFYRDVDISYCVMKLKKQLDLNYERRLVRP